MNSALMYARLGWAVVPLHDVSSGACSCSRGASCDSAGKHPRLSNWPDEATTDQHQIAEWWRQWPNANIGIATGEASGFFVVDVDPRNGGDATLAALREKHGPLPATVEAGTGGGGEHYLLRIPSGRTINNGKLGPGLDIKGDGGQIVVAPSVSARGAYQWKRSPWHTGIAEAPAWLLAELGRAPAPRAAPDADRGYFPPASPAVLDAAREALAQHGPAVDGDSGGLHTVHAAALLTHDFALTDDEAWPLLLEWNATCVPPWEPDELRERLRRGRKYGKHDYGCRRSMDALEAARKLITDWQAAGCPEPQMMDVITKCREMAKISGDTARRAIIEKDLSQATGLGPRALQLPKPAAPPVTLKQGEIKVSTDLHRVADESLMAIAPRLFQRNGVLCEVARAERTWIRELDATAIRDFMSQSAVYVRNDEKQGGVVSTVAPMDVAAFLHSRRTHPSVRVIEAVTSAPVFLADGSILQDRGYNASARVFLEPDVTVWLHDSPTLDDAREAVARFRDLLADFRFASDADFSAWMAALLSPLVKSATRNAPTPLFVVSASTAGAGKSLLVKVLGQIVTGADVELRPYNPRDPAEWGKRITSYVKAGSPFAVFDNVAGHIGDAALDALLTASTWSDRQLGASDAPPLPVVTTWLATGNNLEPEGDTVRRSLIVRLETLMERPQDRAGFRYDLEGGYALDNRGELLSAALTILRGFHLAGRPVRRLNPWGSFSTWSALVRGALVWAGCVDPFDTQKRAQAELNEPEHDAHDFWIGVIAETDGTPQAIVMLANQRGAAEVLGLRESLTMHRLRTFVQRFVDKPRGTPPRFIRRVKDGTRTLYRVES